MQTWLNSEVGGAKSRSQTLNPNNRKNIEHWEPTTQTIHFCLGSVDNKQLTRVEN